MNDARNILIFFTIAAAAVALYSLVVIARLARGAELAVDPYAQNWVDELSSKRAGVCCYDNDGRRLEDPEWRTAGDGYEVHFPEGWLAVPPDAIVEQKNRDGIARVWSIFNDGKREIKCFLRGALS